MLLTNPQINFILLFSINNSLKEINHSLQLPENLEQGYEPSFFDKQRISSTIEDFRKTFNKINSTISKIDRKLEQVNQ